MIKSSEIGLAAGQTIFHRMAMMSSANLAALTAVERVEFTRMYREKVQAALAAGNILARELINLNKQLVLMAWSQSLSTTTAIVSPGGGRNAIGAFSAHDRLMTTAARRAADATQKISTAMTRAAAECLTPIHSTVSANAKRLGRKKRVARQVPGSCVGGTASGRNGDNAHKA
jgi:hypothetical protein